MIGTVTLNPSVDVRYMVDNIAKNAVTRIHSVQKTAGGKGLNVSRVINLLHEQVVATGFFGGANGTFLRHVLQDLGIADYFVDIEDETRNCIAVISNDLTQTELLEPGPNITANEMKAFLQTYEKQLQSCTIVTASGSVPKGIPLDIYKTLIENAHKKGVKFLLDTSGEALRLGIEAKPFFIKPNMVELRELTGKSVLNQVDMIECIQKLHEKGVNFVVISRGDKGALASFLGKVFEVDVPNIQAVNSVGSGDSFVAGVAVALKRGYTLEDILAFAAACGTANALEAITGFVNPEIVNKIRKEIHIRTIIEL